MLVDTVTPDVTVDEVLVVVFTTIESEDCVVVDVVVTCGIVECVLVVLRVVVVLFVTVVVVAG